MDRCLPSVPPSLVRSSLPNVPFHRCGVSLIVVSPPSPYTAPTGDDGDEYAAGAAERVRARCEPDAAATTEDPSRAGPLNANGK
jgi:hypothetical protein